MSFIVDGFSVKCLLVSVFPASKKFGSDLELDARMHKTKQHDGECGDSLQLPPQENIEFNSGNPIHWQC